MDSDSNNNRKTVFLSVRLTPDEKENLTELSEHLGVSKTAIVRKAISSELRYL